MNSLYVICFFNISGTLSLKHQIQNLNDEGNKNNKNNTKTKKQEKGKRGGYKCRELYIRNRQ